jgi:hypothetical protein
MGSTILLFLIPVFAWLAIAKLLFKHEFTFQEMAIQAAVTSVVIAGLMVSGFNSMVQDTKMVNGAVTQMDPRKESCSQMWRDWPDGFCTNQQTRSVRDGQTCTTVNNKRTCTPKYKTQYRSVYSWERRYFVKTDLPSTYEIKRVDAQGVNTPPRFAEVQLGDPVSNVITYTNYIKGAADTLFNQKYEDVPPLAYPKLYDYYKTRRVIYFGTPADSKTVEQWNAELSVMNTEIRKTGANVIINVTGGTPDWAERLAQAWDAHNINDVVVTIGVGTNQQIGWVDVRSWSSNELVDITIRDEIMNIGVVDPQKINYVIKTAVTDHYKLRDMEEFEYLAEDIPAPTWVYILAAIVLLIVTPAVTWFLSNNDNGSHRNRFRN